MQRITLSGEEPKWPTSECRTPSTRTNGWFTSTTSSAALPPAEHPCPAGGQPVWAKPGDELSWRFAHAVATEAPGATESALHMAAKTMVAQSVNYIRQDNGAYPIWLRCECGYSAGTMPIQGQHLVAKTERQSTSNTRRDVVIQQPDGTSRYVMEILVTHAVEPDAWRCYNTANIPAGEAMAGWGNAAHNAARRSRQNVQPRPHTNLPCRHGTRKESAHR